MPTLATMIPNPNASPVAARPHEAETHGGSSPCDRPSASRTRAAQPKQGLEQHKATIKKLFLDENRTLHEVMQIMKTQYDVVAS